MHIGVFELRPPRSQGGYVTTDSGSGWAVCKRPLSSGGMDHSLVCTISEETEWLCPGAEELHRQPHVNEGSGFPVFGRFRAALGCWDVFRLFEGVTNQRCCGPLATLGALSRHPAEWSPFLVQNMEMTARSQIDGTLPPHHSGSGAARTGVCGGIDLPPLLIAFHPPLALRPGGPPTREGCRRRWRC